MPLDACPLDPELPQEVIEQQLIDAGCDPKTGKRRVSMLIEICDRNEALRASLEKLVAALEHHEFKSGFVAAAKAGYIWSDHFVTMSDTAVTEAKELLADNGDTTNGDE
jgi:hypothetical protein